MPISPKEKKAFDDAFSQRAKTPPKSRWKEIILVSAWIGLVGASLLFVVKPKLEAPASDTSTVKEWREKAYATLPDKERLDWHCVSIVGNPLTFTYIAHRIDEGTRAHLCFKAVAVVAVNPDNPEEKSLGTDVVSITADEYDRLAAAR